MSTKRIQAIVKVDPTYIPPVIGRNGSNIQRILSVVGNGCYIEGVVENGNGVFKISAYTEDAVKHAMKEIASEIKAIHTRKSSKESETATETIPIEPVYIPKFIGQKGCELRKLEKKIGNGCFLVVINNQVVVRTQTSADLPRAVSIAREAIQTVIQSPSQSVVVSKPKIAHEQTQTQTQTKSPNRFDSLENEEPKESLNDITYAKVAQRPVPSNPWKGTALKPPKTLSMIPMEFPKLSEKVPTVNHWGVWKDDKKVDEIKESIPTAVFVDLEPRLNQLRLEREKEARERLAKRPLMMDLTMMKNLTPRNRF